ncbi:MAG: site-2 protease family protein [Candidatus Zixiibacteriota bacterium]
MFEQDLIHRAIIYGPVILFSLTLHEFFHAWTAMKFGDPTAARLGRLTLNPLAHLDLMGTIVMVASGFRFGWAKPVPVNPLNLRNPRVADIWISAAGPLSNLALALLCGLIFRVTDAPEVVQRLLMAGVVINVTLAFFNMIPLFPLDGSHVLRNLLPREMAAGYERFEQFAPWLLLIVVVSGLFWRVLGPVVGAVVRFLLGI